MASNNITRVISGTLLLAGVVAAIWILPPIAVLGIAIVVSLLAFREYVEIAARAGTYVSRPAGAVAVALACAAVGMPGLPVEAAIAGTTLGLSALALGDRRETGHR